MRAKFFASSLLLISTATLAEDGQAVFAQNCAMCHQSGAVGLAGQFPRLAGRIGPITAKPEGRAYVVDVLTSGLAGRITVDKEPIIGVMPPFPALSDEKVAAVVNYLRSLGQAGGADLTTEEVTRLRGEPRKSPGDIMKERKALEDAKVVP